ncbi:MAG: hypothetical protein OXH51_11820 [Gemmatimonadetes bacterium]|nr:hypothetical protein [Gemmatimonadota bacterium]MCY3612209.1 hypothetical protein [Gemmatimonadota bacterium]
MSIVKASFRNAVRRRWKFALAVFVFGVGLAALTNAYDVTGTMERLESIGGQMENEGGQPTDEQREAIAGSAPVLLLFSLLTAVFSLGAVLLAFLMPGGLVSGERRSAAIMLWAQHPLPLSSFYLRRYVGIQIATATALVIFGLTGAAADLPSAAAPATEIGGIARLCLVGLLACAVSFAISALGIRRAGLFGFIYYLASGVVWPLIEGPELGTSTAAELARAVLPLAVFPNGPLDDLVAGFESGVAWDWGATGLVLYHFALWTGVAWLGLRRIERRPLKL